MSSLKQIDANRANAQLSTGPSPDAQPQTKYNATRHGLTGKQIVIYGEDPDAYEALRQDLINAYKPANAAELMLVEEIAQDFWRLQRARAIETETFILNSGGAAPVIAFGIGKDQFDRVRRYMTTIERAYHRAIKQLEDAQKLRAKLPPAPPEPVATVEIGFVSQTANISQTPNIAIVPRLQRPENQRLDGSECSLQHSARVSDIE
jgi:hypothetical protein